MTLNLLATVDEELEPGPEAVLDRELAVSDDVLVKVFALGAGAELEAHTHDEATNVFHVLRGTVVVRQGEDTEEIVAPGVVHNERGQVHGARNPGDEPAILTASLCPLG